VATLDRVLIGWSPFGGSVQPLRDGDDERLFGGEGTVEGRLWEADPLGHLLHRQPRESGFPGQLESFFQDLRPPRRPRRIGLVLHRSPPPETLVSTH
jgi:hypothetical protein